MTITTTRPAPPQAPTATVDPCTACAVTLADDTAYTGTPCGDIGACCPDCHDEHVTACRTCAREIAAAEDVAA